MRQKFTYWGFLIILSFMHLSGAPLVKNKGPENSDCLACHDDKSMTMVKNGKTISISVAPGDLAGSVHSRQKCINCHKGFNIDDIPHKKDIRPIDCSSCHQDAASRHKFHPQMAYFNPNLNKDLFNCKKCHGTHKIKKPESLTSLMTDPNTGKFCGKCHPAQREQDQKSQHHVAFLNHNPNAPTCIYCHQKPITRYWAKDEIELREKQQNLCNSCHSKEYGISNGLKKLSFAKSIHGKAFLSGVKESASCEDCHGIHEIGNSDSLTVSINKFGGAELCRKCHITVSREFSASAHGIAQMAGKSDAPGCATCHSQHYPDKMPEINIIGDDKGIFDPKILEENKMIYCVVCHTDQKLNERNKLKSMTKAHEFLPEISVHLNKVKCMECHSTNSNAKMPHYILQSSRAIRDCIHCHGDDAVLFSNMVLYNKQQDIKKYGYFRGTYLGDAGESGQRRNLLTDTLAIGIAGLLVLGMILHAYLRKFFNRERGGK